MPQFHQLPFKYSLAVYGQYLLCYTVQFWNSPITVILMRPHTSHT